MRLSSQMTSRRDSFGIEIRPGSFRVETRRQACAIQRRNADLQVVQAVNSLRNWTSVPAEHRTGSPTILHFSLLIASEHDGELWIPQ